MKTEPGGAIEEPLGHQLAGSSTQPPSFVQALIAFRAGLDAIVAPLNTRPLYVPSKRRKWRPHLPKLSRTCADAMDYAAPLFAGLSFSAQDLRDLEEEVRQTGIFLVYLARTTKTVGALLLNRKMELCDKTLRVVEQVQALRQLPTLDPATQAVANRAHLAIQAVVAPANQAVQRKRDRLAALRRESADQAEQAARQGRAQQIEAHILRGGTVTADLLRAAQ